MKQFIIFLAIIASLMTFSRCDLQNVKDPLRIDTVYYCIFRQDTIFEDATYIEEREETMFAIDLNNYYDSTLIISVYCMPVQFNSGNDTTTIRLLGGHLYGDRNTQPPLSDIMVINENDILSGPEPQKPDSIVYDRTIVDLPAYYPCYAILEVEFNEQTRIDTVMFGHIYEINNVYDRAYYKLVEEYVQQLSSE